MTKGRLEAFSDGVLAIAITIMVLELKVPHEPTLEALGRLWPVAVSYVLSFAFVGIYWNNHHHMFHVVRRIDGNVLWANLLLLFRLSLIPFVTGWMGENEFARWPVVLYGVVLICCALSYTVLVFALVAANGKDSPLARALGSDWKGNASLVIYVVSLGLAFVQPLLAIAGYSAVAAMWFIPDRRMERALAALETE